MDISTLAELQDYYPSLLILQYREKTRWTQLIQSIVQEAWLDGIVQTESACFDLDTAVGAQLDIIGKIVGVSRNIYGLDLSHTFFELTSYTGSPSGINMQLYSDTVAGPEIMLTYRTDAIYSMSEFEMRTMIKFKIIYNNVMRSTKGITEAMFALFGSSVTVVDNKNMSLTLSVKQPYYNVFTVANYLGYIPKPMGISYTINYI